MPKRDQNVHSPTANNNPIKESLGIPGKRRHGIMVSNAAPAPYTRRGGVISRMGSTHKLPTAALQQPLTPPIHLPFTCVRAPWSPYHPIHPFCIPTTRCDLQGQDGSKVAPPPRLQHVAPDLEGYKERHHVLGSNHGLVEGVSPLPSHHWAPSPAAPLAAARSDAW